MEQIQSYVLPISIIVFFIYRIYRFKSIKKQIPNLIDKGAVIIDVRSGTEFLMSANPNSINIPLEQLLKGIKKIDKTKPVIVCCASGSRSGMAVPILKGAGFKEVINAGPWTNTVI